MKDLLKRPIAFHPVLARLFGGINEAILWQQIHYWSDKCKDPDGWVYKSKQEIEEETTLTRDQQDRARASLEKGGWIKTELRKVDGAPTLHYQCQIGLVENTLMEKRETSSSIEKRETSQSSITESTKEYISADAEDDDVSLEPDEEFVPVRSFGRKKPPSVEKDVRKVFHMFAKLNPASGMWLKIPAQRDAAKELLSLYSLEKIQQFIDHAEQVRGQPYAPSINSPHDLLTKLVNLKEYVDKHSATN